MYQSHRCFLQILVHQQRPGGSASFDLLRSRLAPSLAPRKTAEFPVELGDLTHPDSSHVSYRYMYVSIDIDIDIDIYIDIYIHI